MPGAMITTTRKLRSSSRGRLPGKWSIPLVRLRPSVRPAVRQACPVSTGGHCCRSSRRNRLAARSRLIRAKSRSRITFWVDDRADQGTQLVRIHYDSPDPRRAANSANAHAGAYIENILDARLSVTRSASSWMGKRVEELRSKLQESEAELQAYREQEKLIDADGVQALPTLRINDLSARLVDARRRLSSAGSPIFKCTVKAQVQSKVYRRYSRTRLCSSFVRCRPSPSKRWRSWPSGTARSTRK